MFSDIYGLIVNFVFGTAAWLVLMRVWIQLARVPFTNDIAQWMYTFFGRILRPMEKLIPRFRNLNLAAVLLAYLVCVLWAVVESLAARGVFLAGLGHLLTSTFYMVAIAVFVFAISSFLQPASYNPFYQLIIGLVRPLMVPIRKFVPPLGPIDFSPAILMLLLAVVYRVLQEVLVRLAAASLT